MQADGDDPMSGRLAESKSSSSSSDECFRVRQLPQITKSSRAVAPGEIGYGNTKAVQEEALRLNAEEKLAAEAMHKKATEDEHALRRKIEAREVKAAQEVEQVKAEAIQDKLEMVNDLEKVKATKKRARETATTKDNMDVVLRANINLCDAAENCPDFGKAVDAGLSGAKRRRADPYAALRARIKQDTGRLGVLLGDYQTAKPEEIAQNVENLLIDVLTGSDAVDVGYGQGMHEVAVIALAHAHEQVNPKDAFALARANARKLLSQAGQLWTAAGVRAMTDYIAQHLDAKLPELSGYFHSLNLLKQEDFENGLLNGIVQAGITTCFARFFALQFSSNTIFPILIEHGIQGFAATVLATFEASAEDFLSKKDSDRVDEVVNAFTRSAPKSGKRLVKFADVTVDLLRRSWIPRVATDLTDEKWQDNFRSKVYEIEKERVEREALAKQGPTLDEGTSSRLDTASGAACFPSSSSASASSSSSSASAFSTSTSRPFVAFGKPQQSADALPVPRPWGPKALMKVEGPPN